MGRGSAPGAGRAALVRARARGPRRGRQARWAGHCTARSPTESGTLAAALLGRYPEMAGVGYRAREPGLLHRLDTRTSGLVIAARTPLAFGASARGARGAPARQALPRRWSKPTACPTPAASSACSCSIRAAPAASWWRRPTLVRSGARACRSTFRTLARAGRFALRRGQRVARVPAPGARAPGDVGLAHPRRSRLRRSRERGDRRAATRCTRVTSRGRRRARAGLRRGQSLA